MMRKRPWHLPTATNPLVMIALFAALAGIAGCGHTVDHKISDRVAAALPRLIGPADSYQVKTATDSLVVLNGKIRSVEIVGDGVRLSPAFSMDQLTVDARDIVVDPSTHRLSSFGAVDYAATLGQTNLSRYLALTASRPGRPRDFGITLNDTNLSVSFKEEYLGVNVPVTVSGTLQAEIKDPSRLDFVPSGGALGVVPVPESIIRLAVDRVNPVVDLANLRIPLTVSSVRVQQHQLLMSGSAKITPQLLASMHQ